MKMSWKFKFLLYVANIIFIVLLYFWIPVSTLVMIATLPAILFSIYTKKAFLIALTAGMFIAGLSILIIGMIAPYAVAEFGQNMWYVLSLYRQLYPYEISVSVYSLLNPFWLLITTLFVFFAIGIGRALKFSMFNIMITFSYFVTVFSAFYLLLNMFCTLIPPLAAFLLLNPITTFVFWIFYIFLPFIVLSFIGYYLETILFDDRERILYKQDAEKLRAHDTRKLSKILKILAIVCLVALAVIIVVVVIAMGGIVQ